MRRVAASLALLVWLTGSIAVTRHVPAEYSTIQAALDSLQDNDTVLVAVGTYAEALRAPARSSWVLRGDVVPDSGNYPRPVIDPSSLPRADTVTCLILDPSSSNILIEDFAFRNGPEMYGPPTRPVGGLNNHSQNLTIRRCLFDSTFVGLWGGGTHLFLEDCRFEWNRLTCATPDSGPITATNCLFSCNDGAFANVYAFSYSAFNNCVFRDNQNGSLLVIAPHSDSTLVEDCVFGPSGPNFDPPLRMSVHAGNVVRNCVFTDCQLGEAIATVTMNCTDDDPMPVRIAGNVFQNYQGGMGQGGVAIIITCGTGGADTYLGAIEDNVFMDGGSSPLYAWANAIEISGRADVNRNRFTRLQPLTVPVIYAHRTVPQPNQDVTLRDNLFDPLGIAARAENVTIDARWNWWGDSTGPYHPSLNPNGQGATVGDNVEFDPWYPDTSFLSSPRPRTPLPQQVSIEAYPNPFNATVTLTLRTNRPGIFEVSLFNLLGQKVEVIWSGALVSEKRFTLNGDHLPSGLYFVRVWQPIENRPAALQKVALMK